MCAHGGAGSQDYAYRRERPASAQGRAGICETAYRAKDHSPTTKNDPAPHVNCAEVEKRWDSLTLTGPSPVLGLLTQVYSHREVNRRAFGDHREAVTHNEGGMFLSLY